MQRITLLTLCLLCSFKLFASHAATAELRYEYIGGGNMYRVYLTVVKACEPGNSNLGPSETVYFNSSCGGYFNRILPMTQGPDTMNTYCGSMPNSCAVPGSMYPGFITSVYSDTVTMDPCADWKIYWTQCCRNNGINNLSNPGSQSIYLEATLDNSAAHNTSTWTPNPATLVIPQNTTTIIPLYTVDAESDSFTYEWVQPSTNSGSGSSMVGSPINYNSGYSLANPLGAGGSVAITGQTLSITAPLMGKFVLALKIKEYRNGVMVGSTMRDFNTLVLAPSAAPTVPMPVSGTGLNYPTCPGSSNSITINFTDATATDYVTLEVTNPSIPGWTFTSSVIPGTGSATATMTWTTPSTMNPANLPQFYFVIKAYDNACPGYGLGYYAIAVQTTQCPDSVWPGDANYDWTVNLYDPLAIAVAFGQTGSARPAASNTWQAQYCAPWANSFTSGVNMKHADCNGNGTVGLTDLVPVALNYGQVHLKPGTRAKVTGVPDLYFDVTGINFTPGATVSIPVKLGTAGSTLDDLYGLAANISVSGITLAAPLTVTYPVSWIGNSANTLNFLQELSNENVDWAYARTNHQNVSGQGTIANVNFTIPASITTPTLLSLSFGGARIIDNDMNEITAYNVLDTVAMVTPVSIGSVANQIYDAFLTPNPSHEYASLHFILKEASHVDVTVTDITGKVVTLWNLEAARGIHNLTLPSSSVSTGVYMIKVQTGGDSKTLKWLKN